MTQIFEFLNALSKNNNREWFHENKSEYKSALDTFSKLVSEIIAGISKFDPELLDLEARDTIFRIYKDIRFSKDKTPYKTHFGAYMAKGGRKSPNAGYYFHIEPENSFLAAGVYMVEKERLKAIRQEIVFQPEVYMKIVGNNNANGYSRHDSEDKLKKAPKGFSPDFKYVEELKFKHYIFAKEYSNSQLLAKSFVDTAVNDLEGLYPYVDFLNSAMDYIGNE